MAATVELALTDVSGPACCPDGLTAPMDRETAEQLARLLKAVADPARLQLLALLKSSPEGSACVCDLTGPARPVAAHREPPPEGAQGGRPGAARAARDLGLVLRQRESAAGAGRRTGLIAASGRGSRTSQAGPTSPASAPRMTIELCRCRT